MLGVRFHSKVRIGARKSIADENIVTKFELVQENRLQIKILLQSSNWCKKIDCR